MKNVPVASHKVGNVTTANNKVELFGTLLAIIIFQAKSILVCFFVKILDENIF